MNTDIQLHQGDCLEVLKTLNDNSVDSVVTDPPYGINFMGKKWDYNVPNVEVWQEVLRVLKPGGHALVACGTRTQHRMAVNLEDAGFEIRDIVAWVYGSGFPKSQNIGKSVDKLQGNERNVIGKRSDFSYDNSDRNSDRHNETEKIKVGSSDWNNPVTKGNSKHEGWGTALKPAMELFTLCRKPLAEKTIALNVLKYNTGGINIDGCRIGNGSDKIKGGCINHKEKPDSAVKFGVGTQEIKDKCYSQGRFPANFIHDGSDEVVTKFPDSKSGGKKVADKANPNGMFKYGGQVKNDLQKSEGSASRFFYAAKASKSERNKGLEKLQQKQTTGGGGGIGNYLDDVNSASGKYGSEKAPNKNNHPTVKPIKLMKYLCRLITPVDGIVLDPYMGSGSTGIAAKDEGFNFTGIELDKYYFEIAKARVNAKEAQEKLF